MSPRRRSAFVRSAVVLLLPTLAIAAPPRQRDVQASPCRPLFIWLSDSRAAEPEAKPGVTSKHEWLPVAGPDLESARWDVVAVGAGWSGTLTTTWVNGASESQVVPLADISVLDASEATLVRGDGSRQPIPVIASEGTRARRDDQAPPPLLPGERLTIEVKLRGSVEMTEDQSELELPSILRDCPPRAPATTQLEAHVEVTGGGEPIESKDPPAFVATTLKEALVLDLAPSIPIDAHPLHVAWKSERAEDELSFARSRALPAGGHEVTLMLSAPAHPADARVRAKEVVFVLDTSGSMEGAKLAEATKAIESCLGALGAGDAFGLVGFDEKVDVFRGAAIDASKDNAALAREWLASRSADGGTMLDPGLRAGLGIRRDAGAHRMVVVVTDGRVGDGAAAAGTLRETLGDARLLIVLVGEDGDIFQARRLADVGRGEVIASGVTSLTARMTSMLDAFSSPVAWDMSVDWGPIEPRRVFPERAADLYAGRPLSMRAVFDGDVPDEIRVVGSTADGDGTFLAHVVVDADAGATP